MFCTILVIWVNKPNSCSTKCVSLDLVGIVYGSDVIRQQAAWSRIGSEENLLLLKYGRACWWARSWRFCLLRTELFSLCSTFGGNLLQFHAGKLSVMQRLLIALVLWGIETSIAFLHWFTLFSPRLALIQYNDNTMTYPTPWTAICETSVYCRPIISIINTLLFLSSFSTQIKPLLNTADYKRREELKAIEMRKSKDLIKYERLLTAHDQLLADFQDVGKEMQITKCATKQLTEVSFATLILSMTYDNYVGW